jgi:endoglucanase
VPIWLGESGENTNEWIASFRRLLERNNIGWCFWPYKRMDASRCIVTFGRPGGWEKIQAYDRACRSGYGGIRAGRPPMAVVRHILDEYLRLIQFTSCRPNAGYITALGCSLPGGPVRH